MKKKETTKKPGKVKAKPTKPEKVKAMATGKKDAERLAETVRKAHPLAAALIGFLESVGMRPTAVVRLEIDRPERKKPTARKAEGPKLKKKVAKMKAAK